MILCPQNLFTFPRFPPVNTVFFPINPGRYREFSTFNTTNINSTEFYIKKLVILRHVEKLGIINFSSLKAGVLS